MRPSRHDLNLILVSAIWGGNYSASKLAVAHTPPLVFSALRFLISTTLLWLIVLATERSPPLSRRTFWILIGWGFVGYGLNQVALLYGLRYSSPTNAALIFSNLPVVVALLGIWLGAERPSARVWTGIALGTIGVAVVVAAKGTRFESTTRLGDVLNVLALLFWALFTVGIRGAAQGLSALKVSAVAHLGATPGLAIAAIPVLVKAPGPSLHPSVWPTVAYAALLASVLASILWTQSLKAVGGSRTALFNCVTPIFAALSAWMVFGERPVPVQALGAALVFVGVVISGKKAEVASRE